MNTRIHVRIQLQSKYVEYELRICRRSLGGLDMFGRADWIVLIPSSSVRSGPPLDRPALWTAPALDRPVLTRHETVRTRSLWRRVPPMNVPLQNSDQNST